MCLGEASSAALQATDGESSPGSDSESHEPRDGLAHPVDPALSTDRGNDIVVEDRRFSVSQMARPHQVCALRAAAVHIDEPRGQIVMACGTGKTLVGLWLTEMRVALRPTTAAVLVLFPNLMLIRQTLATWLEHKAVSFSPLVVCSDASVADSEECAGATAEDFDIAVTTTVDEIAAFLQGGGSGLQVVFATYQSAARVGEAQGGARFDLAIFDEAHKTAGSGSGFFPYALSEENLSIGQRVFMTATPRISSRAALSMDNTEVYGGVWYRLSFAEAAEQGIIVPYKVLFIAVDSEALGGAELGQAVVADMDFEGVNRPPTAREGAIIAATAKTMDERNLTKAISFHSRNANAERFVQYAGAMFEERQLGISLERVDGKMSTEERGKIMEDFKSASAPMIMANARCLQEGVDVPALDLAILVDPKYSMVDIAQLVGRVMRTSVRKTEGFVLVPIFVEGGESPQGVVARSEGEAGEAGGAGGGEARHTKRQRLDEDEASEESDEGSSDGSGVDSEGPDDPPDAAHGRYKVAVAVLRALMQHDDQLAATLRDIRARAGREGRPLTREEVQHDFPYFGERVDISALEGTVSPDALWAAIGTLVELSTNTWEALR